MHFDHSYSGVLTKSSRSLLTAHAHATGRNITSMIMLEEFASRVRKLRAERSTDTTCPGPRCLHTYHPSPAQTGMYIAVTRKVLTQLLLRSRAWLLPHFEESMFWRLSTFSGTKRIELSTAMIDALDYQIKQEQAYLRQYNLLANGRPMRLLIAIADLARQGTAQKTCSASLLLCLIGPLHVHPPHDEHFCRLDATMMIFLRR